MSDNADMSGGTGTDSMQGQEAPGEPKRSVDPALGLDHRGGCRRDRVVRAVLHPDRAGPCVVARTALDGGRAKGRGANAIAGPDDAGGGGSACRAGKPGADAGRPPRHGCLAKALGGFRGQEGLSGRHLGRGHSDSAGSQRGRTVAGRRDYGARRGRPAHGHGELRVRLQRAGRQGGCADACRKREGFGRLGCQPDGVDGEPAGSGT